MRVFLPSAARIAACALLFACSLAAAADSHAGPRTLGWLEWSYLLPGPVQLKTKLDTGARTSSIDAVDIMPYEHEGARWVRFRVPLSERPDDSDHGRDLVLERPVAREILIKEHAGDSSTRYVVRLDFCIDGMTFTTPVSLTSRKRFNYPVLLGRIALKRRAIVDPAGKFTADKLRCTALQ